MTLGSASALALLALGAPAAFDPVAQEAVAGMGGMPTDGGPLGGGMGAPLKPVPVPFPVSDPAARSARSTECAQRADAQGLQGRVRKHFLHDCKRGV